MNRNVEHTKLVDDILVDLCMIPRVRAFKMTTGAGISFGGNPLRFGLPGMFDVLVCAGPLYAWLDAKTGRATLNSDQKKFQKLIQSLGGVAEAVHSVEEARAVVQRILKG